MLLGLIIRDLAIAKNVEINFDSNLIIFTGETGAGKTIIMNAIALSCGGNASPDIIRTGADSAVVEASFSIENSRIKSLLTEFSLYEGEDTLVVLRTISKTRSKVVVNGHLVSLRELQEIGKHLVDLHGQHEIQSLLDRNNHLSYLDKYGEVELSLREQVTEHISEFKMLCKKIEELLEEDKKFKEERDFINFEIDELEKAHLKEGEEEELDSEYKILSNAKELTAIVEEAVSILSESEYAVIKQISKTLNLLSKATDISDKIKDFKNRLEADLIDIKEVVRDLTGFLSNIVIDPERLSYIEARLDQLSKLKLKYRRNIKELIDYLENLKERVKGFNDVVSEIESLEKRKRELEEILRIEVKALSEKRHEVASKFERAVEAELKDLAMESAKFKVQLSSVESPPSIEIDGRGVKLFNDGIDTCEFLISPNPPHDFKPLINIASGGELSRVMLAIKHVIAKVDEIPVLAFDEVDAGIGGKTGEKVAEKLLSISRYRQVICITHLPQIAALPGTHFVVEKHVTNGETELSVRRLSTEYERVNEIARMISGTNITETTIKQAKELLGRWKDESSRY